MKPADMKAVLQSIEAVIPHLDPEVSYTPDRIASRCCRFLGQDVKGRQVKEALDALDCEPMGRNWSGLELEAAKLEGFIDAALADCEKQGEDLVAAYRNKYLGS